jgi:hypothetical protein
VMEFSVFIRRICFFITSPLAHSRQFKGISDRFDATAMA